ncbi:hypothetical protein [Novosphingobium kaempferiae]|uniref:hypothetical protein n=1 Tax=Novosphingobium kaempferiae TaxID=2896849 RepID=UPI001E524F54|nr:hypothetical protein [Novosphingobium kaempferiae]
MIPVEVFGNEESDDAPLFVASFDFLPRVGENISKDVGGYFAYYEVVEIWHREDADSGTFRACLAVKLND